MKTLDPNYFHKLYGVKKPRIYYQSKDFLDYVLMTALSAAVILLAYGRGTVMGVVGLSLCALLIPTFIVRHGVDLHLPLLLRRPQDVLYMFFYKVRNIQAIYLFAAGALLLENYLIYLTPNLPHHTDLARRVALYLFYGHFALITLYRTIILLDHLRKKDLVQEVLLQTSWKGQVERTNNIVIEILHAYFTGILTHALLIAPWYLAITYLNYSVLFLPAVLLVNMFAHSKFMKRLNYWFYRDHWLGHNSEMDFVYLHGSHHDAIPCGLIGVSGNGYLEGVLRHMIGHPTALYSPIVATMIYTMEVVFDIRGHQYIPGVYPEVVKRFHTSAQHSTHHYGRLEPYSIGFKLRAYRHPDGTADASESERLKKFLASVPPEIGNSASLDEELNGFEWDNPTHRKVLALFEKYQK